MVAVGLWGAAAWAEDELQEQSKMATTEKTGGIVQAGAEAPDFSLAAHDGSTVRLKDLAGKRAVVVYFYPKADTPGCTKEACGFRDAMAEYKKMDVAVLGVSPDSVEDVKKFSDKYSLTFPLLADADHSVSEKYGVWQEKSMAGRMYWGVARTTFVIKGGKIVKVFEKVKPEGHEGEVLGWIEKEIRN